MLDKQVTAAEVEEFAKLVADRLLDGLQSIEKVGLTDEQRVFNNSYCRDRNRDKHRLFVD